MVKTRRFSCVTKAFLVTASCTCLLAGGCDTGFTPKTDFEPRLVVYAVLDPSAGCQVVRLARSYDAEITAPPVPLTSKEVASAAVSIECGGHEEVFHDTTVSLRGGGAERVWICRDLVPEADKQYTLRVTVDGFPAVATTIQAPGRLYPTIQFVSYADTSTVLTVQPGNAGMRHLPYGTYYRMWIVLRSVDGGVEKRAEVPISVDFVSGTRVFPSPTRNLTAAFPKNCIRVVHDELTGTDTTTYVKQILLQAYAMDSRFYMYYKTVRGFEDPRSIRIDHPNLSFVEGGYGVFGIVIPDSARFNYHTFIH
ncbi:MAG: DUF4249 family protein [Bacteroidota bacterium]|nr:DUF4249 family protein [Bacteroidota bacterium]